MSHIACPKRFRHSPVRIRFPNRTEEIESMHEPTDLLGIHDDSHVKKPHIYAEDTFLIASEIVSFQDQLKIFSVLRFFSGPSSF